MPLFTGMLLLGCADETAGPAIQTYAKKIFCWPFPTLQTILPPDFIAGNRIAHLLFSSIAKPPASYLHTIIFFSGAALLSKSFLPRQTLRVSQDTKDAHFSFSLPQQANL